MEAAAHLDMRNALNGTDGLTAEQIDASDARNVAVRITADWAVTNVHGTLPAVARDRCLVRCGSCWHTTGVAEGIRPDSQVVADLIFADWIELEDEGLAGLTADGAAALAALQTVPSVTSPSDHPVSEGLRR